MGEYVYIYYFFSGSTTDVPNRKKNTCKCTANTKGSLTCNVAICINACVL